MPLGSTTFCSVICFFLYIRSYVHQNSLVTNRHHMKRSLFGELWFKAFRSGSPLNLFIAINLLVFVFISLISLITALDFTNVRLSNYLITWLSLPADLPTLLYKPWTFITYMFTQQGFFHLLFNMLWLYWLGMIFLDFLNKRQFVFVYLAGGILGGVLYLAAYNLIPVLQPRAVSSVLLGASASVSAIIFATATLLPDYSIRMLFFGNVRLKYLALVFIVLDIIAIAGLNAGGSIAHIGGAIFGHVYIRQLQNGNDWSLLFRKKKKRRMRIVRNSPTIPSSDDDDSIVPNQEVVDRILDKISQSGYDSLTKTEKETLFKASRQGKMNVDRE